MRVLVLFVLLACLAVPVSSQGTVPTAAEKREAEKAWEALIKAKGGRAKLHSLTNVLTEFANYTHLDIFPNSYWDFLYYPVTNTPGVRLWDGTKSMAYYANSKGLTSTDNRPVLLRIAEDRIPFVLETKWDKPELLRVTQMREGKKKYDVIETRVEGERLDFIYEPEEMLVLFVNFYDESGELSKSYSLSNYTEINGIKMPQIRGTKWGINMGKEKFHYAPIKFSFNVDYDPQLFTRPLIATTADAWKRKP